MYGLNFHKNGFFGNSKKVDDLDDAWDVPNAPGGKTLGNAGKVSKAADGAASSSNGSGSDAIFGGGGPTLKLAGSGLVDKDRVT